MADGPGQPRSSLWAGRGLTSDARNMTPSCVLTGGTGNVCLGEGPPGMSGQGKHGLPPGCPPRDANHLTCQGWTPERRPGRKWRQRPHGWVEVRSQLSSGVFSHPSTKARPGRPSVWSASRPRLCLRKVTLLWPPTIAQH